MSGGATFRIMGSGAGPGAPSFFCDCAGCRDARENPAHARTRSGALVTAGQTQILLDTPPDLRAQLVREQIKAIDRVFLTHWHYDHFGGIGELEYYVKLQRKEPIPLYLPPTAVEQFARAFPDLDEVFAVTAWRFNEPHPFDGVTITPLPANHGIETAGFLVASAGKRLAYFPDTAGLPAETAGAVAGVDWLVCDATFHGDNWFPHSHMSVDEAIGLGREVGAGTTVLTHMSIHYSRPVTAGELQETVSRHPNVLAAHDGMKITL
ncbi:MBL fold metallo-hydrolase [Geobacter sp. FeAm09]|uniref:MBL fold metallo-hydrolase n=1 Tax=Geobacter sp. FeAm09 TaxID=2597769 RepID=UPI0011EC48F9|nr:MBL fold metallo-hydrolase [Geobacter sp. FeAm09]QEM67049.1 MBL fold metallo-hydrolase [Geobacter sp. FeAm09]